jgi:hypothetical protein
MYELVSNPIDLSPEAGGLPRLEQVNHVLVPVNQI